MRVWLSFLADYKNQNGWQFATEMITHTQTFFGRFAFLFFVLRCGVQWKFALKRTLLICVFAYLGHGAGQPKLKPLRGHVLQEVQ